MIGHKLLVGLIAAVGLAVAPTMGVGHPTRPPTAVVAKTCRGYVKATIGGETKCLRRGEFCSKQYKSQYRRYGFTCSGDPARLH